MSVDVNYIRELAAPHFNETGGVITALRSIQAAFRCIPEEADETVADVFNISRAELRGIVSFYTDFTRRPKARIVIRLCAAEACQAAGGRQLQSDIEALTSETPQMSALPRDIEVEPVYCLGLCSAAPAAMVGNQLVGRADAERIKACLAREKKRL